MKHEKKKTIYISHRKQFSKVGKTLKAKGFKRLNKAQYLDEIGGTVYYIIVSADKAGKKKRAAKKDRADVVKDRYHDLTPETINKMTLKALEEYIYISNGNEKLKSDDNVLFLVWNTPAGITCPNKTIECYNACYALIAEKVYIGPKVRRRRNLWISGHILFEYLVIRWIDIKLKSLKDGRKIIFRIHESGDFYSQSYTDKWLRIINHYKDDQRIEFIAYTKSVYFFERREIPENLHLLFSLWPDTPEEDYKLAKKLGLRIYTAYEEDDAEKWKGVAKCRCYLCGGCQLCEMDNIPVIAAVIRK